MADGGVPGDADVICLLSSSSDDDDDDEDEHSPRSNNPGDNLIGPIGTSHSSSSSSSSAATERRPGNTSGPIVASSSSAATEQRRPGTSPPKVASEVIILTIDDSDSDSSDSSSSPTSSGRNTERDEEKVSSRTSPSALSASTTSLSPPAMPGTEKRRLSPGEDEEYGDGEVSPPPRKRQNVATLGTSGMGRASPPQACPAGGSATTLGRHPIGPLGSPNDDDGAEAEAAASERDLLRRVSAAVDGGGDVVEGHHHRGGGDDDRSGATGLTAVAAVADDTDAGGDGGIIPRPPSAEGEASAAVRGAPQDVVAHVGRGWTGTTTAAAATSPGATTTATAIATATATATAGTSDGDGHDGKGTDERLWRPVETVAAAAARRAAEEVESAATATATAPTGTGPPPPPPPPAPGDDDDNLRRREFQREERLRRFHEPRRKRKPHSIRSLCRAVSITATRSGLDVPWGITLRRVPNVDDADGTCDPLPWHRPEFSMARKERTDDDTMVIIKPGVSVRRREGVSAPLATGDVVLSVGEELEETGDCSEAATTMTLTRPTPGGGAGDGDDGGDGSKDDGGTNDNPAEEDQEVCWFKLVMGALRRSRNLRLRVLRRPLTVDLVRDRPHRWGVSFGLEAGGDDVVVYSVEDDGADVDEGADTAGGSRLVPGDIVVSVEGRGSSSVEEGATETATPGACATDWYATVATAFRVHDRLRVQVVRTNLAGGGGGVGRVARKKEEDGAEGRRMVSEESEGGGGDGKVIATPTDATSAASPAPSLTPLTPSAMDLRKPRTGDGDSGDADVSRPPSMTPRREIGGDMDVDAHVHDSSRTSDGERGDGGGILGEGDAISAEANAPPLRAVAASTSSSREITRPRAGPSALDDGGDGDAMEPPVGDDDNTKMDGGGDGEATARSSSPPIPMPPPPPLVGGNEEKLSRSLSFSVSRDALDAPWGVELEEASPVRDGDDDDEAPSSSTRQRRLAVVSRCPAATPSCPLRVGDVLLSVQRSCTDEAASDAATLTSSEAAATGANSGGVEDDEGEGECPRRLRLLRLRSVRNLFRHSLRLDVTISRTPTAYLPLLRPRGKPWGIELQRDDDDESSDADVYVSRIFGTTDEEEAPSGRGGRRRRPSTTTTPLEVGDVFVSIWAAPHPPSLPSSSEEISAGGLTTVTAAAAEASSSTSKSTATAASTATATVKTAAECHGRYGWFDHILCMFQDHSRLYVRVVKGGREEIGTRSKSGHEGGSSSATRSTSSPPSSSQRGVVAGPVDDAEGDDVAAVSRDGRNDADVSSDHGRRPVPEISHDHDHDEGDKPRQRHRASRDETLQSESLEKSFYDALAVRKGIPEKLANSIEDALAITLNQSQKRLVKERLVGLMMEIGANDVDGGVSAGTSARSANDAREAEVGDKKATAVMTSTSREPLNADRQITRKRARSFSGNITCKESGSMEPFHSTCTSKKDLRHNDECMAVRKPCASENFCSTLERSRSDHTPPALALPSEHGPFDPTNGMESRRAVDEATEANVCDEQVVATCAAGSSIGDSSRYHGVEVAESEDIMRRSIDSKGTAATLLAPTISTPDSQSEVDRTTTCVSRSLNMQGVEEVRTKVIREKPAGESSCIGTTPRAPSVIKAKSLQQTVPAPTKQIDSSSVPCVAPLPKDDSSTGRRDQAETVECVRDSSCDAAEKILPPPNVGEYDVVLPTKRNSLLLTLRNVDGAVVFTRYSRFPDGTKGAAETQELIRNVGDSIVAVDGVLTADMSFDEVLNLLRVSVKNRTVRLRFLERRMTSMTPFPPTTTARTSHTKVDASQFDFEVMFIELKNYKKVYGNCDVPRRFCSDRLALWAKYLRSSYSKFKSGESSSLPWCHIEKLDKVGFDWTMSIDPCDRPQTEESSSRSRDSLSKPVYKETESSDESEEGDASDDSDFVDTNYRRSDSTESWSSEQRTDATCRRRSVRVKTKPKANLQIAKSPPRPRRKRTKLLKNLQIMNSVDGLCRTTVDSSRNEVPTRKLTVYNAENETLYDFIVEIHPSNITNSGNGAFLTFLGARVLTDAARALADEAMNDLFHHFEDTMSPLNATMPDGRGVSARLCGDIGHGFNNGPIFVTTNFPLEAKLPNRKSVSVKLSGEDIHYDLTRRKKCNGEGGIGFLGLLSESDYIPDDEQEFCSYFEGCGLVDLGRYGPFLKGDLKTDLVFCLKNFIYGDEPAGWSFDVPEMLGQHNQVVDITADATGEPHKVARSNISMYVNEVGHSNSLVQNVVARDKDDRIVQYYLHLEKSMRKGETRELLVDYLGGYESTRERKGYGKANFEQGLASDENEAARILRNCNMRQKVQELISSMLEEEIISSIRFIKTKIFDPIVAITNDFVESLSYGTKQNDLGKAARPTARQWVARRRIDWLSQQLEKQIDHVGRKAENEKINGLQVHKLMFEAKRMMSEMRWSSLSEDNCTLEERVEGFSSTMRDEISEELLFLCSQWVHLPFDESEWCPISIRLLRDTLHTVADSILSNGANVTEMKTELLPKLICLASDAGQAVVQASDALLVDKIHNQDPARPLCFRSSHSEKFSSCKLWVDAISENKGFHLVPNSVPKILSALITEVQAYRDAMELCGMAVCTDVDDMTIEEGGFVLMTKQAHEGKERTEFSEENGKALQSVARTFDLLASGALVVDREWYLVRQVVFVVHAVARSFLRDMVPIGSRANVVRVEDDLLRNLCSAVGVDVSYATEAFSGYAARSLHDQLKWLRKESRYLPVVACPLSESTATYRSKRHCDIAPANSFTGKNPEMAPVVVDRRPRNTSPHSDKPDSKEWRVTNADTEEHASQSPAKIPRVAERPDETAIVCGC